MYRNASKSQIPSGIPWVGFLRKFFHSVQQNGKEWTANERPAFLTPCWYDVPAYKLVHVRVCIVYYFF